MSPVETTTLTVGDLQTNCYLVWCTTTQQAVIIDPGDAGEFIVDELLSRQLTPVAVVLTHAHFDHVLGVLALVTAIDVPVYLHPKDRFLLDRAAASAEHWLRRTVDPVLPSSMTLDVRQPPTFGNCTFTCLETPGHTPGSVCLEVLHQQQSLRPPLFFTGDTLFKAGIGRTDFSYSSADELNQSLQLLGELSDDTRCFPGHGQPTTIAAEITFVRPRVTP